MTEHDPILSAARAGDQAAFATLVDRHRRELHVHCYRMVGSFEEAEDLVQETFLRAWRKRESFEGGPGFRAWLYRIATNASLDAIRSRSRRVASLRLHRRGPVAAALPRPAARRGRAQRRPARGGRRRPRDDRADLHGRHPAAAARSSARCSSCATCSTGRPPRPPRCSRPASPPPTARCSAPARRCASGCPSARPTGPPRTTSARTSARCCRASSRPTSAATPRPPPRSLRDDVRVTMPPNPWLYEGIEAITGLMRTAFDRERMGDWRLVPTRANRQPAAASYLRRPGDERLPGLQARRPARRGRRDRGDHDVPLRRLRGVRAGRDALISAARRRPARGGPSTPACRPPSRSR